MATILVVDDNPMIARMLGRFLENKGHRTVLACNGQEALKAAKTPPEPDLILLDLCMPEMDGMEVLRRLNQTRQNAEAEKGAREKDASGDSGEQPKSEHAPQVIFFSAIDDPAVIASAMRNGARDYWVKASFRFDDLPKVIERYLEPEPKP